DPELDQRPDVALSRDNPVSRRLETPQMAGPDGGLLDAARSFHVDDAPAGEIALEGARRLFLDLGPRGVRYRRKLAMQVIHQAGSPLRDPIPSEPSRFGAGCGAGPGVSEDCAGPDSSLAGGSGSAGGASSPTFSRNVAEGTKKRLPVLAMLKSSRRS